MITITNYFERKDGGCIVPFQDIINREYYHMNCDYVLVTNIFENGKIYIDNEHCIDKPDDPMKKSHHVDVGYWKRKCLN